MTRTRIGLKRMIHAFGLAGLTVSAFVMLYIFIQISVQGRFIAEEPDLFTLNCELELSLFIFAYAIYQLVNYAWIKKVKA